MPQVYPSNLPSPTTFGLKPDSQLAFSPENEMGPVDYRRRTQQTTSRVSVTFRYLENQYKIFKEWWKSDLLYGHRWFLIRLPSAGGLVDHVARFVTMYSANQRGYRYFEVSAELEIRERVSNLYSIDCALYLDFEGPTIVDRSRYAHTISVYGSATASTVPPYNFIGLKSLHIPRDGAAPDYIKVGYSPALDFAGGLEVEFTMQSWLYIDASSIVGLDLPSIIDMRGDDTDFRSGWGFYISGVDTIRPKPAFYDGSTLQNFRSEVDVPLREWFHWRVVKYANRIYQFINGRTGRSYDFVSGTLYPETEVGIPLAGPLSPTSTTGIRIGNNHLNQYPYVGGMDEFLIFRKSLGIDPYTPPQYPFSQIPLT